MRIDDIEVNPAYINSGLSVYSVALTIQSKELKKYKSHSEIIDALRSIDYIYHIEEMT
jgi:putative Mg2+ transporter-C (MgtC) family protein